MKELNKENIDNLLFGINVNNYNRFEYFLRFKHVFNTSEIYSYALESAYTNSDNLYQYRNEVKQSFLDPRVNKELLIEDKEYFNSLPSEITIYRGMSKKELESNNFGLSWTLDIETARFFANEYLRNLDTNNEEKIVHSIKINKNDVIAFFTGRKENEIIYISL